MSEPKEGTKFAVKVIKDGDKTGLRIDLNGIGEDIIRTIVTAMRNEEVVEDLVLEAAKQFMYSRIKGKLGRVASEDRLGDLLQDMAKEFGKEKPEATHDFSGVADLLTEEEKKRVIRES